MNVRWGRQTAAKPAGRAQTYLQDWILSSQSPRVGRSSHPSKRKLFLFISNVVRNYLLDLNRRGESHTIWQVKSSPWATTCGIVAGLGTFVVTGGLGIVAMGLLMTFGVMEAFESAGESVHAVGEKISNVTKSAGIGVLISTVISILAGILVGRKVSKSVQKKEAAREVESVSTEQQPLEITKDVSTPRASPMPPVISDTTTCVWCREEVKVGARVCKHCGRDPNEDSP